MSHPKTEAVRQLLTAGLTNTAIGRQLRMERQTVGRIRRELGMPNVPLKPSTVEEKWRQQVRELPGGHMEWTGSVGGPGRTPVLRYGDGVMHTAGRIAFRIANGTDPVGLAKPDCGMRRCVAPAHQYDTATRQPVHKPLVRYTSAEAKLAALTEPTDDGHVRWIGPVTKDGFRILSFNYVNHTPARIAFRAAWEREPVGPVLPACDYPHCLLGAHLDDKQARDAFRSMFSAVFGR